MIYLCGAFRNVPNISTDPRDGTLIHEASHIDANGDTEDYVHGQADAENLTKTDPSTAIFNADNHEYFAENPTLPWMLSLLGLRKTISARTSKKTGLCVKYSLYTHHAVHITCKDTMRVFKNHDSRLMALSALTANPIRFDHTFPVRTHRRVECFPDIATHV